MTDEGVNGVRMVKLKGVVVVGRRQKLDGPLPFHPVYIYSRIPQ